MKLKSIFSSGMLLLQNAVTEFKGKAIPNKDVVCSLLLGDEVIRTASAKASCDGAFSLPLRGETASYKKYTLKFVCENETVILDDIVYGELWLAAGQSNMEMVNLIMENCSEFLDIAQKHEIRAYKFNSFEFTNPPFEPAFDNSGEWRTSRDKDRFIRVSAAASAAALVLAEHFAEEGKEVPIGIVDTSIGATFIEAWLPLEYTDGVLKDKLKKLGRLTPEEKRTLEYKDVYGENSVYYNALLAPLFGMKMRGMLWYQGESNVRDDPFAREVYKEELELLQSSYASSFSPEEDKTFPLIASLLFPWIYNFDGRLALGNINLAIVDAATENQGRISAVPIHDLPAKWSYFYDYHPIHPTNKYGVGERLGSFMLTNTYGVEGLKTAAYYKKTVRKKGSLELHFETFGRSLGCEGTRLKGFYVCGRMGTFIPADAEIISRTAVRVSSEYIAAPSGACYQVADLAADGNLFCDGLPVAPFSTVDGEFSVVMKPWLFADTDHQFCFDRGETELNVFNYPVRFPTKGSFLNYDPAYNAVRITAEEGYDVCGMYFIPRRTMPLDLQRYTSIVFTVYARPEVGVSVKLTLKKDGVISERICKSAVSSKEGTGIIECKVPFKVTDDTTVEKLELLFNVSKLKYPTLAIGNLALVPKKS